MRKKDYPLNKAERFKTLSECLKHMKTAYAGRTALTFYEEDGTAKEWSFRQFTADVEACIDALIEKGLVGAHIAIVSENCYEWVVAFFGITCSGGVVIAIDVEQTEEEIRKVVRYADAVAVIVSESYESVLGGKQVPGRCFVIRKEVREDSFAAFLESGRQGKNGQRR